jgi:alkylation response protein AidB-like acyl-CoA dehydrogenase
LGAIGANVLGCVDVDDDDLSALLAERSVIEGETVTSVVPAGLAEARVLAVVSQGQLLGLVPAERVSLRVDAQPYDQTAASVVVFPIKEVRDVQMNGTAIAEALYEFQSLARLCLAAEILGACDALMDRSIGHAKERRQFGVPIETFQSIQHLLATAESQRVALEAAVIRQCGRGLTFRAGHQESVDATLLKALAGATGTHLARSALQVLGASGFTWENQLHRYARRVLSLDGLWGSSARLATSVGTHVLGGQIPRSVAF